MSIIDVPDSDRQQDVGQYTLEDLRRIMLRSIVTMRIGQQASTEIMLKRALLQTNGDPPSD